MFFYGSVALKSVVGWVTTSDVSVVDEDSTIGNPVVELTHTLEGAVGELAIITGL
jgi:hypothetical protein